MRRMATSKQLDYINDLQEVAEKRFEVGTYPAKIEVSNEGDLDWSQIQSGIENKSINFENHTFGDDIYLIFYLPRLLEQYGLGEDTAVGYINYVLSKSITMPNSVVDFDSLKTWMQSDAFITAINAAGYLLDECLVYNSIAGYGYENPTNNIKLYNGELKISTSLVCSEGQGKQIVGASDPIGTNVLDVVNLQAESAEIKAIELKTIAAGETNYSIGNGDGSLDILAQAEGVEDIHTTIHYQDNYDGDPGRHTMFVDMSAGESGNIIIVSPDVEMQKTLRVESEISCGDAVYAKELAAREEAELVSLTLRGRSFRIYAGDTNSGQLNCTEQYFVGNFTNIVQMYPAVASLIDYGALNSSKTIMLKDANSKNSYDALNNIEIYSIVNDELVNKMV